MSCHDCIGNYKNVPQADGGRLHTVEIGQNHTVVIDKLFGPAVARNVRVRMNWEPWQYIFERDDSTFDEETGVTEVWTEVGRCAADPNEDGVDNNNIL